MSKGMKRMVILLSAAALLAAVMAFTKPSEDRYIRWAAEKFSQRMEKQNPLMKMGFSMFGQQLIEENTTAADYGVAMVYETEFRGKRMKVLGIFGLFIPLGKPDSL